MKEILQYENLFLRLTDTKFFDSMEDRFKKLGIKHGSLRRAILGDTKTMKGWCAKRRAVLVDHYEGTGRETPPEFE